MGHLGFSYIGLIWLAMLFIPNFFWTKCKPAGYDARGENKFLAVLERIGEVWVTCAALIFSDFNVRPWSAWSVWLVVSALLMLAYEGWWIKYFRSKRTLKDFYSGFLGVPLAGATLPVAAFLCLGIYGKVIWLIAGAAVLGAGHIGIHVGHYLAIKKGAVGGAKPTYERAGREDIPAVLQCRARETEAYAELSPKEKEQALQRAEEKISEKISNYVRVKLGDETVGYYFLHEEDGGTQLDDLYVLEAYRGRGIGAEILKKCAAEARGDLFSYVFLKNEGARRFYARFGFETENVFKDRALLKRRGERFEGKGKASL